MKQLLEEELRKVERAWQALTDGELWLFLRDGSVPLGPDWPEAVTQALLADQELGSWTDAHSQSWWVVRGEARTRVLNLVACSARQGDWRLLLQSWADILAFAIQEHRSSSGLVNELAIAWDRLTFLYQLAQHIASGPSDLNIMLSSIVALLAQVIDVGDVFMTVEDGEGGWKTVSRSGRALPNPLQVVEAVLAESRPVGRAALSEEVTLQAGELLSEAEFLVTPLRAESGMRGVIGLLEPAQGRFSSNDVQLLASVAEQVGALIEVTRTRVARQQRQKLEHELSIAGGLQESLLPVDLPKVPGVELVAFLRPAYQIGGDFYDFAVAHGGEPLVLLADVAGKGMPAAILTAIVHAIFHGEAPHASDPARLLATMNRLIYPDLDKSHSFVTAVIAMLHLDPLGFSYSSAGHMNCLLWRQDEQRIISLPATGLPLGINPEQAYQLDLHRLDPGDVLVMYSDGVTEAENPGGAVFGMQGLSDIIYASHPASAEAHLEAIVQALEVHCDGMDVRDDVALLMIKVQPEHVTARRILPFVLPSKSASVSKLVDLAREAGQALLDQDPALVRRVVDDFALALDEAVSNQIQHAYQGAHGRLQGRISVYSDRLEADLFDYGVPFETSPRGEINLDDPPDRGYGLRLMDGLLDSWSYKRLDDIRNHWNLVKGLGLKEETQKESFAEQE